MKLYHYSKEPYLNLLTRRMQGKLSQEEIRKSEKAAREYNRIGAYVDHISFFLQPIPSDLVSRVFKPKAGQDPHPVWFKGNQLFEHVVLSEKISHPSFELVESFRGIALLDEFCNGRNWSDIPMEEKEPFFDLIDQKLVEWGEIGRGKDKLDSILTYYAKNHPNATAEGYSKVASRPDFQRNRMKYAASVPHIMIYPADGVVQVESINTLTIGNPARRKYIPK